MKQKITIINILLFMAMSSLMAQENPMERARRMVGTWDCVETYHAGGWSESEVVSTRGKDMIQFGINNQYITADYQSESPIGNYKAYALIYFEPVPGKYMLSFFDNFGNQQFQTGSWKDENTLRFSSPMEMNGRQGDFIRTYSFEGDSKQILKVSFESQGTSQDLITIVKTKV